MSNRQTTPLREKIRQYYALGWSVKDIAQAVGSTPGSVRAIACQMRLVHPIRANDANREKAERPVISLGGPEWSREP